MGVVVGSVSLNAGLYSRSVAMEITLQRDGIHEPFGFKVRGGCDLKEPLIIQRVPTTPRLENIMASPVANLPVTSFAGSQLSRQQELFAGSCAGDRERIVVTNQPYRTTPLVLPGAKVARDTATTQTTSYLALQTNPLLWSSTPGAPSYVNPQQAASDALLRQKLEAASAVVQRNLAISAAAEQAQAQAAHEPPPKQEVVHKQFNSPLGLYSKENVEEVMALQSGLIPPNPKAQPA